MFSELTTPCVTVDLDIVERNIEGFASRLKRYGISHRPHIKTHKSIEMGRRQLAAGAIGITAAKLGEAEVFAAAGFDNILLAYPVVGNDKLERFSHLHQRIRILTTVDSLEVARGLGKIGEQVGKPVEVLIELDLGMHRCGVQPEDAVNFAVELRSIEGIEVVGVMEYNAIGAQERNAQDMREELTRESSVVSKVVSNLKAALFNVQIVSSGSTVAGTYPDVLQGITEVRSGTYIYNDATTVSLGLASVNDCAIKVLATVVSAPLEGRATIDAGSKTLTSDPAINHLGYGMVSGFPDIIISGLNEEHGYLRGGQPSGVRFGIGDRIQIIPNHACVISNLTDTIYAVRGNEVVGELSVDARGRNN